MEPVWDSQGAIDIDWLEVDKSLLSLTYPLFAGQEGGAYLAVQRVMLNLQWDLLAAISAITFAATL